MATNSPVAFKSFMSSGKLRASRTRLKILMVRVRMLYPADCGGKIRTARHLDELSKEHDVTLITYRYPSDTDHDVAMTAKHVKELIVLPFTEAPKKSLRFAAELALNVFQSAPYIAAKYASPAMKRKVAEVYDAGNFDLVICDFLQSCEAISHLKDVPYVIFQHNAEATIFKQLADRGKSLPERLYLNLQWQKLRSYERKMCRGAQRIIAVSDIDKEHFARDYGVVNCDVVPTGVDTEFYHPSARQTVTNNLVFTGSMDWLANQDAIHYFVDEIFPLIRKEIPDTLFSVVGRNPPDDIRKLGEIPGVNVTGTVADIRPFVHGSKVYVVPLRIGSGTRIKLLEAMSMGKAIVSTTVGAEGLPVKHNHNILLADSPQAFADSVVRLMRDNAKRTELEINARDICERDHGWNKVGRVFNDICYRSAGRA